MQFTHPVFFYCALALIPLLIGAGVWGRWRRGRDLEVFGTPGMVARLYGHLSPTRRTIRNLALGSGVLLLCLALAGPQYGVKMVEVRRQGVDVIIALDVSRSMLAEDVKPNRLQRAQQELATLIDRLGGDRVGVIAFAGSAQVACPLTTDYSAAKMFLNYLTPETVALPGTALGRAIRLALKTFPQGGEGYRVLVLLTDGEDHRSEPMAAAREAKAAGVRIISIGFGSPEGEPIPERDSAGRIKKYLKNQTGQTVVSKLDEKSLKEIAALTGGAYLPAHEGNLEAGNIAEIIGRMQKREVSAGQYGAYEDRFQYVLFPALMLLMLAFWLPGRRGAWLWMFPMILLWALPVQAGMADDINKGNREYKKEKYETALKKYRDAQIKQPEHPIIHYNMGNTLYKLEKYPEAEQAYNRALKSKNRKLRAKTLYNLGNNNLKQEQYAEAVKRYQKALKLKPRDEDTIYNLSQALALMKQPPPKNKPDQKPDKKKDDSKEKSSRKQQPDKEAKDDKDRDETDKKTQAKSGDSKNSSGPDDRGQEQADQDVGQQTPDEEMLPKPGEMSRENAGNILDAVREAEQDAQRERMKKMRKQGTAKGRENW
ncbi:VWA domain-containing protein [bacterium]|nr:VWA domain-containing protein [bacterium]